MPCFGGSSNDAVFSANDIFLHSLGLEKCPHAVALLAFTVTHLRPPIALLQMPNPLLVEDTATSLKNLNLSVPPPRLRFQPPRLPPPISKSQEGFAEEEIHSEVKVTILKRPDVVAAPLVESKKQPNSSEDREEEKQPLQIMKRPEVHSDITSVEENFSQDRAKVKSLRQREEEYAEARQRIMGGLEEVVPSSNNDPCAASASKLTGDEVDSIG